MRHVWGALLIFVLIVAGLAPLPATAQTGGEVVAWGQDSFGQLGVPSGLTNVVAVAGGEYHTLALKDDGTVAAWGYNGFGQSTVPTELTDPDTAHVVDIAAALDHSLALKSDGTVAGWASMAMARRQRRLV